MRNLLKIVRTAAIIVGLIVALMAADYAALTVSMGSRDTIWLTLIAQLTVGSAYSVFLAKILPKSQWYLLVIAPILYYGTLAVTMMSPMFLWLDLRFPLLSIAVLAGAYVGKSLP